MIKLKIPKLIIIISESVIREAQRPREYRGGALNTDGAGEEGCLEEVSLD